MCSPVLLAEVIIRVHGVGIDRARQFLDERPLVYVLAGRADRVTDEWLTAAAGYLDHV